MHSTACIFSLFLILNFFNPSTSLPTETICNYTPFPSFCKSILPPNNSASIQDHGRFSIQQSILTTENLLSLINGYLELRYTLPEYTIRALEDCLLLSNINTDFFANTLETIRSADTLVGPKIDDLLSLLSATLTNLQTCLDGLESITSPSSIKSALQPPLLDGNMLYSVALAIFKHGWVPNTRDGRMLAEPPEATSSGIELYPGGNTVKVNQTVFVNPNGSGDFTDINDAVAAAPNNTDGSNGYFLIYVAAGVYEEYVYIAETKRYLMMIGDGIDQTIVTGNRSVVDGWTTFTTATFGKPNQ